MHSFTDRVVELGIVVNDQFDSISDKLVSNIPYQQKIDTLNTFFEGIKLESSENTDLVDQALALIFESNGLMSIADLQDKTGINERKLERLFAKHVDADHSTRIIEKELCQSSGKFGFSNPGRSKKEERSDRTILIL